MSNDDIRRILQGSPTGEIISIPTSAELRDDMRNRVGTLEMQNENLLIEKRHLLEAIEAQHERYRVLHAKNERIEQRVFDAEMAAEGCDPLDIDCRDNADPDQLRNRLRGCGLELVRLRAALEAIAEHGMDLDDDEKCSGHRYFSEVREVARKALNPQG